MHTFCINTATHQTAIALYTADALVAEQRWPAEHNEAEKLQPAVDQLLRSQSMSPADVDRLVVCVGPGGFTSSRVGVSAVNAWAFAQDLPIAQVSVFDLYPDDRWVLLSANPKEIWIREPDKEPLFVQEDQLSLPESFVFAGVVSEEWRQRLQERGGSWEEQAEQWPDVSSSTFAAQMAQPWYYKEPHITWSKKNAPQ